MKARLFQEENFGNFFQYLELYYLLYILYIYDGMNVRVHQIKFILTVIRY